MLNKSGKSELLILFLILEKIPLVFPLLRMMLAVGLSYMAFIMLK